jgi:hypothetical protein
VGAVGGGCGSSAAGTGVGSDGTGTATCFLWQEDAVNTRRTVSTIADSGRRVEKGMEQRVESGSARG